MIFTISFFFFNEKKWKTKIHLRPKKRLLSYSDSYLPLSRTQTILGETVLSDNRKRWNGGGKWRRCIKPSSKNLRKKRIQTLRWRGRIESHVSDSTPTIMLTRINIRHYLMGLCLPLEILQVELLSLVLQISNNAFTFTPQSEAASKRVVSKTSKIIEMLLWLVI